MSAYSITIRTDQLCNCYHFEFFTKGFQVKYDSNNNTIRQFFPFAQILTVRLDYLYDDKVHVIGIFLKDGMKYSYCMKCGGDAERVYEQIRDAI